MSRSFLSSSLSLSRQSIRAPTLHRTVYSNLSQSTLTGPVPADGDEKFIVKLDPNSFDGYRCDAPSTDVEVSKNLLITMYTNMIRMRRMEMAADTLYKAKEIRGFCHLAIGQEAVAIGMEAAIDGEDRIITAYRCHPFAVLRGGSVTGVLAELMGRQSGMSHGKGGSMHMFTPSFFGGNGIVGAQVPVGAGIAFAQKYLKKKTVTFAMYGDGASNQGQIFESYNMAKLWNLPCVFVCENNKYGMGTPAERSSMNTEYYKRGDVIAGIRINAMDVIASYQASKFAKEWTTSDKGPLLAEYVTYRYGGHSMSDPGTTYRTREEIQNMRATKDCVAGLKKYLIDWEILDEAGVKTIDQAAKKEIDDAVIVAKNSPEPDIHKDLWTDVYYKGTEPPFMRGREREEVHYY